MTIREILESNDVEVLTQIPMMKINDYQGVGFEGGSKLFALKSDLLSLPEQIWDEIRLVKEGKE
tara:strand:+ start:961 stop:1152 length:192 start_codon:yes stop_codon:yes gene_type:complete